jgi:hypothetical protein
MAHIYKLRRDKLLQLIEAENSWWLPPPSSLKPPTPSACVVKTVSGLFVRNGASRQRGVGTDVKSEYRPEDEPTEFAALYRIEFLEDGLRSIHREGPRRAMPH